MNKPVMIESSYLVQAARQFAETCLPDFRHTQQVTRIALRLFDELAELHGMGVQERIWLEISGLLCDVGLTEGWRGHHKASLNIILNSPLLPLDHHQRLLIGSTARYHRRAMPSLKHDHYAALEANDQLRVNWLGGILRLADGLDCTHQGRVIDVQCKTNQKKVVVRCLVQTDAEEEESEGNSRSDLLRMTSNREIQIKVRLADKG